MYEVFGVERFVFKQQFEYKSLKLLHRKKTDNML